MYADKSAFEKTAGIQKACTLKKPAYVPFLTYGKKIKPENLGTLDGFTTVADRVRALLKG